MTAGGYIFVDSEKRRDRFRGDFVETSSRAARFNFPRNILIQRGPSVSREKTVPRRTTSSRTHARLSTLHDLEIIARDGREEGP